MHDFAISARGSSAALPTPYRFGRVDFPALDLLCNLLTGRGISALVPCGPTGEASLLTPEEHHDVIARTVMAAAGRVPVIAGVGGSNAQIAANLARSAERAGATALLCVAPFHLKPSQAGMVAHFRTLHDAVGIPLILSDVHSRAGCALDDITVGRLADLPRIVGLEDAVGDLQRVARLRRRLGPRFLLLSGNDALQASHRAAGGDGCISVTANIAPALCVALHKACDERRLADLRRLDNILAPLHAALSLEVAPLSLKRALSRMGLMGDGLRLPLTPLAPAADRRLARTLDAIAPAEEEEALRYASMHPHAPPRAA